MGKNGNVFCRLIDTVTEKIGRAISLVVLLIMLMIAIEVVARYAFNSPTLWAWPINRQLFGILALFGGAYALLHGRHIRVEVLYERFGPKMKLASSLITAVCFFFFIGILIWQGYVMAEVSFACRETLTGRFHMPLYLLKILIPAAAFLFFLQGAANLWREVTGKQTLRD